MNKERSVRRIGLVDDSTVFVGLDPAVFVAFVFIVLVVVVDEILESVGDPRQLVDDQRDSEGKIVLKIPCRFHRDASL